MSIQEKIRFGKITTVAVAVAMVVMMFIPFFRVLTPYNGGYDANAIELLLDHWYVFDDFGQTYCIGMIVIMAIVFPLVMVLPAAGGEKLDRKRMEQGLNPKAERALDKLLIRHNVWYMLINAVGLVFGIVSMVPAITYLIGDLMGVYVNYKYDLEGCGLVLVVWLFLSVPGLIYNVMAAKLFGYDREEIKLRRLMREKGIYTKEALEADARGAAVVTPPEFQQPVQQQYYAPYQQPMQPPYGQYQQPMQPPYGQYQQPMQPPYGQYQQPMQPPYGQYQQPMQPPYGQYQQPMQPPYGQYQQPMQPPYGQQQQPTQPQPPTPSDQEREE